ncbi:MAG: outer membrane lipoprotein carrier protein LolA [Flavobacteriaceae bacterium]|jgi:outer membrane lipoprotein-sorting protein|nr:outer membrane lipoprotein carrier protein LolA [Flavobacteriaceae bacterium]
MKKIVWICFVFLVSFPLQGQSPEVAKKLLDDVSETIASFENLSFDFSYVLENRQENIRQETTGSATIKGDQYKISFLGNEQLFDGEKTYTIIPENEEITISSPDDDSGFGINPSELLVFYKTGYAYQWDIKQNVKGRPIQFIKLIPNEENREVKYLLLGIDMRTKVIYRLIEIGNSETRTTLTLKNLRTNIPLNSDFFTFDDSKYPDYYINN